MRRVLNNRLSIRRCYYEYKFYKKEIDTKTAKELDLDKTEQMLKHLASFSDECELCRHFYEEYQTYLEKLLRHAKSLRKDQIAEHKLRQRSIVSHLHKKHSVVTKNYYFGVFLGFGTSVGVVCGLVFLDNIGLGLALGTAFGVAVGAAFDQDARKKGNIL